MKPENRYNLNWSERFVIVSAGLKDFVIFCLFMGCNVALFIGLANNDRTALAIGVVGIVIVAADWASELSKRIRETRDLLRAQHNDGL